MSDLEYLADRAVLRLSGHDTRDFLQGVITQDLGKLAPGGAIFACLLTPQGKVLFDFFVADEGDAFIIDVAAGAAEGLVKRLTLYRLRAKITIERCEDLGVCASAGPGGLNGGFADPRLPALGFRAIAPVAAAPMTGDYARRRIALGVPEAGADFEADEVFLMDVNYDALAGVSYKKGCFIGQEVTSRMKRKGEARKRTLIADFNASAAPEKGTAITAGENVVGTVLSGTGGQALALVRLDRLAAAKAAGSALRAAGAPLSLAFPAYLQSA